MSTIKVNGIRGVGASTDAISVNNSDGTCTANITNQLSHKNVIVNGSMAVSQRGTSETGISSAGAFRQAPDRFKFSVDDGTWTVSQDSSGPPGIANSYKVDCTTADTSIAAGNETTLNYKAEGQDLQRFCKGTSSAKKFALSFYVKSNKTGNYAVHMRDQDNTRHVSNLYTISSADTWERKTIVFPADTTGAFGDDNGNSLQITWFLSVGTNKTSGTMDTSWAAVTDANIAAGQNVNLADSTSNYFNLTGVQLEAADACTDFEHRSYGDELLKCQRYCWVYSGENWATFALGVIASSTTWEGQVRMPVTMRAKPSTTISGNTRVWDAGGATACSATGISSSSSNKDQIWHTATCSGASFTTGRGSMFGASNDATAKLTYDAEL